ncbi:MAG: dTDP-4-dehydrorhamnose reductase [Clostridia bacterium]|nr:dTDP-4-dehydrorhamnose reductase [Clostridia bacterium]
MKVLVTGVCGQLGFDVVNELISRGIEVVATDIPEEASGLPEKAEYERLDITDRDSVCQIISGARPDAVIHCAAWTAVDAAEEPENRDKVFAVNAEGTRNIAEACRAVDCKMLYISTDYVFDGHGTEPWEPDQIDYAPLNVYGQSKLEGEQAVRELLEKYFIVRTAWVFGRNGNNFVKTMLRVGKTHDTVRVVNDQIGTPTYTPDLARLLVDMIRTEKYGTYHATNEGGFISWYDFACEIFRLADITTNTIPVTTEEYGLSKAKRPYNSRLGKEKLTVSGFERLPGWKDALRRYMNQMEE